MLLSLCRCEIIRINHASINIETSILGGQRWHGIWRIRWSSTGFWRSLQLMICVMWRAGWLLMNRGQMRWNNVWIIQWSRHRYHRWWQLIVTCYTSVAMTNTLWTWHDECNMSFWCCFVPVILFVDGHRVYVPGINLITIFLSQYNPN